MSNDDQDIIDGFVAQIEDSDLLTIIIEGKDDLAVYNEFEDIYGLSEPLVSVLPVGGRNTALGIFRKLKNTEHLNKTIFIVDKDQWVIKGIEEEYIHDRIICTHGYSFENDIFIDGNLENDLKSKNPLVFDNELPILLKWYALEVDRIQHNRNTYNLKAHIDNIFNQEANFTTPLEGETFPTEIYEKLLTVYPQLLRGKTLLLFYNRVMNKRDGYERSYTSKATIENVCKHKGSCLQSIFQKIDTLVKA